MTYQSTQWTEIHQLSEEQKRALQILQKHGYHATSFQILESGYSYWFSKHTDAVVAYIQHRSVRVVAGPPVASDEELVDVTTCFLKECEENEFRAVFISVDSSFFQRVETLGLVDTLPIGDQPEWELRQYRTDTPQHRTLRSQVRRAERKGVLVRMLTPDEVQQDDGQIFAEIAWIVEQWKSTRRMSPMQFMVALQPFHLPTERRYFIATCERRPVGVLIAIPVYAQNGWFFEDVLRVPNAPNGTVELLIHTAMQLLQEEGAEYATLGLCPFVRLDTKEGDHPWLKRSMSWAYEHLGSLYQFKGLYAFKQRFVPQHWEGQYMVSIGHRLGVRDALAVGKALLGEGVVSFMWDTFRRILAKIPNSTWSKGLFLLGGLLIPWTLMLAWVDGEKWFGDTSIHGAWVVFDTCLAAALFTLGEWIRRDKPSAYSASVFVAGATIADFVLTSVQVFHLHQHTSGWPVLFISAGVLGPLLTTLYLIAFGLRRPS